MEINQIQTKIENGGIALGSHVFCGSAMLTESIAMAGFDLIWIDMEHTAIGVQEVLMNLIAVRSGGACAVVRIPWNDPVLAKPILDMGPDGIVFPYIRTVADARKAVAACEYPPHGVRGYGPLRALDYGKIPQLDYVRSAYRKMWRIIQIEHIDAVDHLEDILSVDGIDAFIIGPNDLAASVGLIGQTNHPDLMPIYDRIAGLLHQAGKTFGVSMDYRPAVIQQWLARGANIIFTGSDTGYVQNGATKVLEGMHNLVKEKVYVRK